MVENKEYGIEPNDIRVMSEKILNDSTELLVVDDTALKEILIPRLKSYAVEANQGGYSPIGSELECPQEVGLNLFLNTINFCYKDPDSGNEYRYVGRDCRSISRATGLLSALANSGIDWNNFHDVGLIDAAKWIEMLQLSETNRMYLGAERRNRVVGMANFLQENGMKDTTDFFFKCNGNSIEMLRMFEHSGYFKDIFLKRAQLAVRMISDVCVRRMGFVIDSIDKLTVMADYRLPQVFYNLGVVSLADELKTALLTEHPLMAGSREETALRACTISIGRKVAENMGKTEAEIDGLLWGLSQKMVKNREMAIPHMIVATDAY